MFQGFEFSGRAFAADIPSAIGAGLRRCHHQLPSSSGDGAARLQTPEETCSGMSFPTVPSSVLGLNVRNLIREPWPYNPNILGFILRTPIKSQSFLLVLGLLNP